MQKLFDKISDFIKQIPPPNIQQQSHQHSLLSTYTSISNSIINSPSLIHSQNSSTATGATASIAANANNNSVKLFEKCTNLVLLLSYRKKTWLSKLVNHGLLANIQRMLKVKKLEQLFRHIRAYLYLNFIPLKVLGAFLSIFLDVVKKWIKQFFVNTNSSK